MLFLRDKCITIVIQLHCKIKSEYFIISIFNILHSISEITIIRSKHLHLQELKPQTFILAENCKEAI